MSRRDRIREKIMARVRIDEVTGCWLWTGPTSGNTGRGAGYPRMSLGGGGRRSPSTSPCGPTSMAISPERRNWTMSAATGYASARIQSTWSW